MKNFQMKTGKLKVFISVNLISALTNKEHEQNLSRRLFTKTLLWTFLKALAFLRKSGPVDFARETDFVHFLCVANFKTAMYLYENQSPPDRISLFSRRNFEG